MPVLRGKTRFDILPEMPFIPFFFFGSGKDFRSVQVSPPIGGSSFSFFRGFPLTDPVTSLTKFS